MHLGASCSNVVFGVIFPVSNFKYWDVLCARHIGICKLFYTESFLCVYVFRRKYHVWKLAGLIGQCIFEYVLF